MSSSSNPLLFHPADGTLDVVFGASSLFQNATAAITYRDATGQAHSARVAGAGVEYRTGADRVTLARRDGPIELLWNVKAGEDATLWLEVINRGAEPLLLDELHVLSVDAANGGMVHLGAPPMQWRFYQHGWQSWSAAFVRSTGNGVYLTPATEEYRYKHEPHPASRLHKTFSGEWFTVQAPGSGANEQYDERMVLDASIQRARPCVLLGFLTTADQLSEVRLELQSESRVRLTATAFADGVRLNPGESLSSERLLVACHSHPNALLDLYARRVAEAMHARIPLKPLTGWCTWYYFYGKNTERDVVANLERLNAERLPLDVVILDDGYQTSDGDWTSVDAEKFPHGLAWLAAEIKRAGRVPGLWVAPFAANENSRLARDHPEFLLRDAAGEPVCSWYHWNNRCFSLDLSRRDVQAWLRELFHTLSDQWGFEFFKLDFVFTAAAPGIHGDPGMTRAQAYRRGMEIIREVVGDKIILGCGAPLGASVGLVDAMRIGPDVSVNWEPFFAGDLTSPATAYAMRNTLTRVSMHNRWWQNDPDCVLVRRRDDESALVLNEMRTMVTLTGLTGGAVLSGDNLPSVRRGRLKYLRQILPPVGLAGEVVDLFDHELPECVVLSHPPGAVTAREGRVPVVAAVTNWGDRTIRTEIELTALGLDAEREYHVYNYWHRRYLGIARGRVKLGRHQPHETRVLLFKPVGPQVDLLGTTFHITQGLAEIKKIERVPATPETAGKTVARGEVLRVELEKGGVQRGQVLFAIPRRQKVLAARINGRKSPYRRVGEGVVGLGLTLDEHAVAEIEVAER